MTHIKSIILFAIIIILCYLICMTKCREHLTDTEAIANISKIYNETDMKMTKGTFTDKLNVGVVPTEGITDMTENVISMIGGKMTISGAKTVATDLSINNKTIIDKGDVNVANKISVGTPKIDAIGTAAAIPADQTVINKGTVTTNRIQLKRNILYFRQRVRMYSNDVRESITKISYKKNDRAEEIFFKVNEWIILITGVYGFDIGNIPARHRAFEWGGSSNVRFITPVKITEKNTGKNEDYWYVLYKISSAIAGHTSGVKVDLMLCAIPVYEYNVESPDMKTNTEIQEVDAQSNDIGYLGFFTGDGEHILKLVNDVALEPTYQDTADGTYGKLNKWSSKYYLGKE